jgi:hypothetical protein
MPSRQNLSDFTVHLCCWQKFSLTKKCTIFSEDKAYFGMTTPNNQLGILAVEHCATSKCVMGIGATKINATISLGVW